MITFKNYQTWSIIKYLHLKKKLKIPFSKLKNMIYKIIHCG